jgi:uncharacterized protein (DUF302 family)
MQKSISLLIGGFVLGVIIAGILFWLIMPSLMLNVHKCKLSFDETVSIINENALNNGWKVPKIYNIKKSLVDAGQSDMTRLKIISLCQPDHAYNILLDDDNKKVTAIMPCRIGVYEGNDGEVYIAEMNMGLMSRMFGGTIAEVMVKYLKKKVNLWKN